MVSVTRGEDGRWYKPCSSCGEMQSYLRRNYAEESLRLKKDCKSCSNKKTENCDRGYYKDFRLSWFNKYKVNAEMRGLPFEITPEYLWQVFEEQDYKCALTNWSIGWSQVGQIHTASIDRIDSDKGYIVGNVQLVHKDVNMSKQTHSQHYFIEMCISIANMHGIK